MTTAVRAQPDGFPLHSVRRRLDRRRRRLEKVLAALVLFVAFAVTVVLLGLQWSGNQSSPSAAHTTGSTYISEVQPS